MNRELDNLIDRHERRGVTLFRRALAEQGNAVIRYAENYGVNAALMMVGQLVRREPVQNAIRQYYQLVALGSAKWQYRQLRDTDVKSFNTIVSRWVRFVQAWILANSGDAITNITDTTLDQIRSVLYQVIEQGKGAAEAARMIKKQTAGVIGKYRSVVIARTEGTRAASIGHLIAADEWEQESGVKMYKEWSASPDSRTRDAHRAMIDKPLVPKTGTFIVGGEEMEFPGDPKASAANVVNCRCRVVYVTENVARRIMAERG